MGENYENAICTGEHLFVWTKWVLLHTLFLLKLSPSCMIHRTLASWTSITPPALGSVNKFCKYMGKIFTKWISHFQTLWVEFISHDSIEVTGNIHKRILIKPHFKFWRIHSKGMLKRTNAPLLLMVGSWLMRWFKGTIHLL